MIEAKVDIIKTILKFSHEITEDKIIIMRTNSDGKTLLKQLEDSLNEQLRCQK